jgi:spermidine/putrescine-binding protein
VGAATASVLLMASAANASTSPALTSSAVARATGTIHVAGWQIYQDSKEQDKQGVSADWTYLSQESDVYTKSRTGDFDAVTSGADTIEPLNALGLAQPIDTSLLSNYSDVSPAIRNLSLWRNSKGQVIAIPLAVSPSFTAYNSAKVPEPKSLADLLKPVYRGAIALVDDPETIAEVATAQGVKDTSKMTKQQLAAAMAYLNKLRPNVKTLYSWGQESQLLDEGDVDVILQAVGSDLTKAVTTNPAIKFNLTAEITYVDAWSIVGTKHLAATMKFINQTLSVRGQDAIVQSSSAFPTNERATPALAALGDPISVATAKLSLATILKEAPVTHGYATTATGDYVSLDQVVQAWDNYKASF